MNKLFSATTSPEHTEIRSQISSRKWWPVTIANYRLVSGVKEVKLCSTKPCVSNAPGNEQLNQPRMDTIRPLVIQKNNQQKLKASSNFQTQGTNFWNENGITPSRLFVRSPCANGRQVRSAKNSFSGYFNFKLSDFELVMRQTAEHVTAAPKALDWSLEHSHLSDQKLGTHERQKRIAKNRKRL